ncbi:MAG: RNA 2',3'-cyclic phosphodiesterase [Deltaproteobacteria bacterium]|nr:RNA 2',3'-cyclic phosphodiesterase [Deltaproteobacteria bacterium]
MEIRSFLAFELPPDIKRVISEVSRAGKPLPLDLAWAKSDNIHLTMVFLGNVFEDKIQSIGETVKKVCAGFDPFEVSPGGVGFFGNRRYPRVLWMGLHGDVHRMGCFRDALQQSLKPFGIKTERRPFKPHLTLGRFKKGTRPWPHLDHMISEYANLKGQTCSLKELVLFKSDLTPEGAIYTKLDTWPLGG